jgi:hypothetical protein
MAFRTGRETAVSAARASTYDELILASQGQYTLLIDGKKVPLRAGEEYFTHEACCTAVKSYAGTRTIHAFGGHQAERAREP